MSKQPKHLILGVFPNDNEELCYLQSEFVKSFKCHNNGWTNWLGLEAYVCYREAVKLGNPFSYIPIKAKGYDGGPIEN